jgi:hypothetical protein
MRRNLSIDRFSNDVKVCMGFYVEHSLASGAVCKVKSGQIIRIMEEERIVVV